MGKYELLREEMSRINQSREHDYCAEQKGNCCSFMIPLTPKDENLLEGAIRNNLIPVDVLTVATERASSMTESRCVFLTDSGCGIPTKVRPLICSTWNEGGEPHLYACDGCKISSLKNRRVITPENNKAVQSAIDYVDGETNSFLPSFFRRALKKARGE